MIFRNLIARKIGEYVALYTQRNSREFCLGSLWEFLLASSFHTGPALKAKLFMDKENRYAHGILQRSKLYGVIKDPNLMCEKEVRTEEIENMLSLVEPQAPMEVLENFKKVVIFCKNTGTCITEEKFDKFVEIFVQESSQFSDEQLKESLSYLRLLPEAPGVNARNFVDIWSALDATCMDRVENWSVDELLLVCDHWYELNLAKASEFVWQALRKIGRKIRRLSPQHMLHTMFFCNLVRKTVFEMFDFEVRLKEFIDELSLSEIGIMSMGFFKTQTPIRNPELIDKIYRRLITGLDTVEDITLVNILKILRYSSKVPQAAVMTELLDKICPQIERLSLLACLHVALTGTDIQLFHPRSFEEIVNRFNKEVDNCRLKDMERITFVISQADACETYRSARELCEKIIIKVKCRVEEIIRHPRCFVSCLHFLTLCGYYDEDLISGALDEKFIKHAYGRNMLLGRELFQLDSFVRINLGDNYKGHVLTDKMRESMGKCLTHYIPERNLKYRLNMTDRVLLEVKEMCEHLYRPCHLKHVLPHFQRTDIVICYDKKHNCALPLSEACPKDYSGVALSRSLLVDQDRPEISTIIVVVAGWNNYIRETNRPTGLFKLKLNQLNLLQHKVVVIPWFEWNSLETATDRQNYIRRKLAPLL